MRLGAVPVPHEDLPEGRVLLDRKDLLALEAVSEHEDFAELEAVPELDDLFELVPELEVFGELEVLRELEEILGQNEQKDLLMPELFIRTDCLLDVLQLDSSSFKGS